MGRDIKYNDLMKLTDKEEMIEIIDMIYKGNKERIIYSCGFGAEINCLNIDEEKKQRFRDFVMSRILEIN